MLVVRMVQEVDLVEVKLVETSLAVRQEEARVEARPVEARPVEASREASLAVSLAVRLEAIRPDRDFLVCHDRPGSG